MEERKTTNFAFKGDDHLGGYKDLKEPIDFLRKFFEVEIIRLISKQTNLYSTQCNINKSLIETSQEEIEDYLLHVHCTDAKVSYVPGDRNTLRTSGRYNEQKLI